MPSKVPQLSTLRTEIAQLKKRHRLASDDATFVFWYCNVCLTDSVEGALNAITGRAGDINVDAIFLDHAAQTVFLVQAKYRASVDATEKRNDLLALQELGDALCDGGDKLEAHIRSAEAVVASRLKEARERVRRQNYHVALHFVTTGRVSSPLFKEFERNEYELEFAILDHRRILRLFADYLEGAVPPVPTLDLQLARKEALYSHDDRRHVQSWVVTMTAAGVARLFKQAGARIFARNIRGFLGSTDINKGMRHTLRRDPERFWYYNNGITIVCDAARQILEHGEDKLRVENPQIINGQQTTRMLAEVPSERARVLVRVIAVERTGDHRDSTYDGLIETIVAATNRQNPIYLSDLRSNDKEQVRLQRELRKYGYLYIRKRQTNQEARVLASHKFTWILTKDQLAQAVGACFLDPFEVRAGKENLFGTDNYPRIFSGRAIATYLCCFWLRTAVRRQSKGKPSRSYAIWLVLHVLWPAVSRAFPGHRQQQDLVYFMETAPWDGKGARALGAAIDQLFREALRFYRLRRGHGEEALDISNFFRRQGLHTDFDRYWTHKTPAAVRRDYAERLETFTAEVQAAVKGS